jgi:ABC-type multidrug transport system ATPase subunit
MAAIDQTFHARGQPAILAEGVGKRFGEVRALDGVDLELPAGRVLALLGPNGAGKTTMVRILATLLAPDVGRARVAGFDVVTEARAVRQRIGLSGQYAAVDAYLTGRENLRTIGRLYGLTRGTARRRAEELLERVDLLDAGERKAGTYSGGMRRRLDVAASLMAAPPCCSWTSRRPASIRTDATPSGSYWRNSPRKERACC